MDFYKILITQAGALVEVNLKYAPEHLSLQTMLIGIRVYMHTYIYYNKQTYACFKYKNKVSILRF